MSKDDNWLDSVDLDATTVDAGSVDGEPTELVEELLRTGSSRYEALGLVGTGGMGAVERVHDRSLRRRIAVKTLHERCQRASDRALGRFVREARITAQLDHPNIVPVHEVGRDDDGQLYFAMKLVEGQALDEILTSLPGPPHSSSKIFDLLDMVIKVCDALAFAHSRGVLHCDLKPSNIMVGDFGEVYLMDWGIARVQGSDTEDESEAEANPSFLGTPAYMAPEQAFGQRSELDARADVFGIGAVLYKVLTGQAPYSGSTLPVTVARAALCSYKRPSQLVTGVPPELERIVLKAMSESTWDRYPSVEGFKQDLVRFQRAETRFPERTVPDGEHIIREGEKGDAAYFIVKGSCEVYRTINDKRVTLRKMGPGEAFGETAILSPGPRTASVVTLEETTLYVVTEKILLQELTSLKPWMGALVRTVADRFRDREEREPTTLELTKRDLDAMDAALEARDDSDAEES